MTDTLVFDAAERLFADLVTPALVNAAEAGTFPDALWRAVSENGFLDPLAAGDGLSGVVDAVAILRAVGRHAVPLPMAETMLARWLLASAGRAAPAAPVALAPVEPGDRLEAGQVGGGWRVRGTASFIPWARHATHLLALAGPAAFLIPIDAVSLRDERNLAGEPRAHATLDARGERLALPFGIDRDAVLRFGALFRAAQMAGALDGVLQMATQYANDRVQFGRPIGKFQAIQQQLALLAEETAAATVAVTAGAAQIAAGGDLFFAAATAKIRAGEAAGKASEIAHQVHGAIGFTHEHSLHRLTRRLWSWRDEFGSESWWSRDLGKRVMAAGAAALWPTMTAR
jgi:acyl-CoA dehydrogenase